MMSIKKIDKIRHLYFDVGMPVRDIWRKTNISPTSIYKYIKMDDFSPTSFCAIKSSQVFT